jgi:hypothetical protein
MATESASRFTCFLCDVGYVRADGLRRHYLSSHRLVWQHGRVSGASENELAARLEVLRHRQMSSRRRRREPAATRVGVTNEAGRSNCRVAAMRSADAVDSSLWPDDDDVAVDFSLPMLPDLADAPTFASADVVCQTDPVVVLSAPPVRYNVEAQTEVVAMESVGTATAPMVLRWPPGGRLSGGGTTGSIPSGSVVGQFVSGSHARSRCACRRRGHREIRDPRHLLGIGTPSS